MSGIFQSSYCGMHHIRVSLTEMLFKVKRVKHHNSIQRFVVVVVKIILLFEMGFESDVNQQKEFYSFIIDQ